jgi:hypothetical protein
VSAAAGANAAVVDVFFPSMIIFHQVARRARRPKLGGIRSKTLRPALGSTSRRGEGGALEYEHGAVGAERR